MSSKLTLYIEDDLINYAKEYAKEHHLSVSRVVNNFLAALRQETGRQKEKKDSGTAPVTTSLKGVLSDSDIGISDYHRYLEEKYL